MSHELLYTSAPAGLKPGTVGFCTVESTQGMPRLLAESLELLSAYRWEYVPPDPKAALNPVNFSHLIYRTGGQKYRILSRVADAGMDYTGRTNKLAHHVVLEPHELAPGGPAYALASPGFCVTQFGGEARWLGEGRRPRHGNAPPGPCFAWDAATDGHAGWAGVLAASALDGDSRPMNVIFPAGMETLPLVVEAMKLLPANRMWDTTFSTYFTTLPPGFDCHWRFLLEGTREAESARAAGGNRLIDLARGVGPAPGTELAYLAEHGTPRQGRAATVAAPTAAGPTAARLEVAPRSVPAFQPSPLSDFDPEPSSHKRGWSIPVVAGGALVATLGIGFGLWAALAPPPVSIVKDQSESRPVTTAEKPGKRTLDSILEQIDEPKPEVTQVAPAVVAQVHPTNTGPMPGTNSKAEATTEETDPGPPLKDLQEEGHTLELPPFDLGAKASTDEKVLARIHVRKANECELDILSVDGKPDEAFALDDPDDRVAPVRKWVVNRQIRDTFGIVTKTRIGEFQLQDRKLSFKWDLAAPEWTKPTKLLYRKLEVRVGRHLRTCRLSTAHLVDAEPLAFSTRQEVDIPFRPGSVEASDDLRLKIQLRGFSPALPALVLKPGESRSIALPLTNGTVLLEYAIGFKREDHSGAIELQLVASGERATVGKDTPIMREGIPIPKVGFPPKEALPFIPSSLKSVPADAPSDIVRINKGVARLAEARRKLLDERGQMEREVQEALKDQQNGAQKAAPLRRRIEVLDVKLQAVASAEGELKKARRITEAVAAWCTEVAPQIDAWRGKVSLEYQVSIPGTEGQYFLVQTKDFEDKHERSSPE